LRPWSRVGFRESRGDATWSFADIIGASPTRREIVLVQCTTADHLSDRLAKVKRVPELPSLLAAGFKVAVHGWERRGASWRVKIVEVAAAELPPMVVCDLPRRRGRRMQQGSLFSGEEG
jgi:hypothetical protein